MRTLTCHRLLGRAGLAACCGLVAVALALPAAGRAASLYTGPGPRPGPSILYARTAVAPQLTNAGVWRAAPILISGASAYRKGEFLYQDFLYDDHGARGGADPGDPRTASQVFSAPNGTYTYPTAEAYAGNAADLVELRVKPLADATAFRLTLNTLKDPALVAATIAIGTSTLPRPVPHGANSTARAAYFLTLHGSTAELADAATGKLLGPSPTVQIDAARRQIDVRVPHASWNPGRATVPISAGIGLWDNSAGRYLIPAGGATASKPGGAGLLPAPSAFFNLAFRFDEPFQTPQDVSNVFSNPAWWRDRAQGSALQTGDLSRFRAQVNFAKLAAATDDDMPGKPGGVPQSGPMNRILASHFETKQGIDYENVCGGIESCKGELRGRLQPYSIYVPRKAPGAGGYGLTLLLHSLGANYNQFSASRNQSQFGDRATGSIVITPSGRGPDGWYYDDAEADTFEVWADAASRYRLDPSYTAITGYSMGGYGTYKLTARYPDLFARAQPTVGPPGLGVWVPPSEPAPGGESSNTLHMLPSMRNVPFLMWNGSTDQLVPLPGPVRQAQGFDDLGYRYELDVYAPADHFALAVHDQYAPAAAFLGAARVDRNPAHVTYVVNPKMDFRAAGVVADHAYWLSGLRLRNAAGEAPRGLIDVRSDAFGTGDPKAGPTQRGTGQLSGGTFGSLAYTSTSRAWGSVPRTPVANRLHVKAENISSVTIDLRRARVSCNARIDVQSDGPLKIRRICPRKPRLGITVHYLGARAHLGARRCRGTRARVTVVGGERRLVRTAGFYVGGRLVARDGRAPFVKIVSVRGRSLVVIRVKTSLRDGRSATLTRRLLPCGR